MNLIISADWHIRSAIPKHRKDNFLLAQENKIKFILDLSKKYNAPIIIAGDIGDKPKWENWLLRKYIALFKSHPEKIYILPGQHDLPGHRLDKISQAALGVLIVSKAVVPLLKNRSIEDCFIQPFPFGQKIKPVCFAKGKIQIAIIHTLVSKSKLWKKQENFISAKNLLKRNSYDIIISGDNHQSFIEKYKDKILINPGSLMRSSISQYNHTPICYLLTTLPEKKIEKILIPVSESKSIFDMSNLTTENKNDKRMETFVNSLDSDFEFEIKFRKNLRKFFLKNKTNKRIKNKILTAF